MHSIKLLYVIYVFHTFYSLEMFIKNLWYGRISQERPKSELPVRLNICNGIITKFFGTWFWKKIVMRFLIFWSSAFWVFGFLVSRNILCFQASCSPFQGSRRRRTPILNCRISSILRSEKSHCNCRAFSPTIKYYSRYLYSHLLTLTIFRSKVQRNFFVLSESLDMLLNKLISQNKNY